MNVNDVIKFPVLTEKSYLDMSNNVYTFAVDKRTNKVEVKKAVEFIFDVKVERVNILTVEAKTRRVGRFVGKTNKYKKALVLLKDGYSINFFPEEQESKKEETSNTESEANLSEKDSKSVEEKVAKKLASKANKTE
ncbi:50S ribosomal protein L23 [[Mycoplasma] gypis]|uniref:Large ribosomal subunit protein uL23 n=1 Tax=[Mycoplasma] gypis TaxID=92404 RepID=A0ABZ2RPU8_9BACT|nr:50S ribosomal protein L23 [[Mycoplasma] gypis]